MLKHQLVHLYSFTSFSLGMQEAVWPQTDGIEAPFIFASNFAKLIKHRTEMSVQQLSVYKLF